MKAKPHTHIFIFFGLPGSGKSYLGKKFAEQKSLYFYEADDDYTDEMRRQSKVSEAKKENINCEFYSLVISKIENLLKDHPKVVVASALGSNVSRHQFIEKFGDDALFVLVKPDEEKHLQNIFGREWSDPDKETNDPNELKNKLKEHLQKKRSSFEQPDFPFIEISNTYEAKMEGEVVASLEKYI